MVFLITALIRKFILYFKTMVIVLNKREDSIVVSINQENLICTYCPELYAELDRIVNTNLPKVKTMEEFKAIEQSVRDKVSEQGDIAKSNFVETACKDHLVYDQARGTYHLKAKDGSVISKIPIPQSLVDRILISVEKSIDPTPVVKAVIRFFRNPNLSVKKLKHFINYLDYKLTDNELFEKLQKEGYSKEKAKEMSQYFQTPITTEGLLCTYKVSREVDRKWALDEDGNKKQIARYGQAIDEDTGEVTVLTPEFVEDRIFEPAVVGRSHDAFWCESLDGSFKKLDHIYKVGCIQYLENWDQVNCNDGSTCVKGLHLGNLDYIRSYEGYGNATHNCFVDPMHIGAFTDAGDGAMRVKQLFIHSSKAGDNRGIYFPSTYAAHVDAEWEVLKKEAMENASKALKELEEANAKEAETLMSL